jgi:hypothetical protein
MDQNFLFILVEKIIPDFQFLETFYTTDLEEILKLISKNAERYRHI